jgi:perosamine synthetase
MLRDHAMPPHRRYWHDEVGFNYRMTNLQAAVGVAQMERIDSFIRRKREIAVRSTVRNWRASPASPSPAEQPGYTNVYWMVSVLVEPPYARSRDELIPALRSARHRQPPLLSPARHAAALFQHAPRPVAHRASASAG